MNHLEITQYLHFDVVFWMNVLYIKSFYLKMKIQLNGENLSKTIYIWIFLNSLIQKGRKLMKLMNSTLDRD